MNPLQAVAFEEINLSDISTGDVSTNCVTLVSLGEESKVTSGEPLARLQTVIRILKRTDKDPHISLMSFKSFKGIIY